MTILNNKKINNIAAIISGVLPIAYLITNDELKDQNKKPDKSWLIKLIGYIFSIATYMLLIVLVENFVIKTGLFSNKTQGYLIALLILIILQATTSFFFMQICNYFFRS